MLVPPTPTLPVTPRRPLARRTHTDNLLLSPDAPVLSTPASMCSDMDDEDGDGFGAALGSSPAYARGGAEWATKRAMQIDYPSPGEPEDAVFWAGGCDVEMKENAA